MSSFGAASVASTQIPATIVRKILHTGSIVKMKVPIGASIGSYPNGDEDTPFLQFCHNIRGGVVNFFVHTNDSALRGKTITALASVLKKTLDSGREYLYVDLVPVSADTPITHRLAVMNNVDGSWSTGDHLIFETSGTLEGVIILAPPGAKVTPKNTVVHMPKRPVSTATEVPKNRTNDSQLERLLAAGWKIESEDPTKVSLFKMKGGENKTMVHHRPKISRS